MILENKFIHRFDTAIHLNIFSVLIVGGAVYFNFDPIYFIVFFLIVLINHVPAIYLHLQYMRVNRGDVFEVRKSIIIRRSGHGIEKVTENEIDKIVIYKAASAERNGWPITSMEPYYFVQILTKTGRELILTCFLSRDVSEVITENFSTVPTERYRWGFCSIHRRKDKPVAIGSV